MHLSRTTTLTCDGVHLCWSSIDQVGFHAVDYSTDNLETASKPNLSRKRLHNASGSLSRIVDRSCFLIAQARCPYATFKVDNESDQSVAAEIAAETDRVRCVRLEKNFDGAGGFRLGIILALLAGADSIC
jgi:hypothetical protein